MEEIMITKYMSICMDEQGLNKVTNEAPEQANLHINLNGGELADAIMIGNYLKNLDCMVYVYGAYSAGVVAFFMIPFKRIMLWNKAIIFMHQPTWSGKQTISTSDLDDNVEMGKIHKKIMSEIGNESDHPEVFKREWGAYCVRKTKNTILTPSVTPDDNPCGPLMDYKKF